MERNIVFILTCINLKGDLSYIPSSLSSINDACYFLTSYRSIKSRNLRVLTASLF